MLEKEALILLGYLIVIVLFICAFIAVFVMFFLKRKNLLLLQKMQEQQKFEKELAKTEIEIKENTLKNIGWELHDNIGQLLSVANIHLNMLQQKSNEEQASQIIETKEVLTQAIQEVRSLSKTLNHDVILKNGLVKSIQIEVDRFNRLKFLEANMEVLGEEQKLESSDEIIIFRIVQEFLSNVIKHAKATTLDVSVTFSEEILNIAMQDNGVGFCAKTTPTNSGTETMRSRAKMIGATFQLNSEIGEGTILYLKYPFTLHGRKKI